MFWYLLFSCLYLSSLSTLMLFLYCAANLNERADLITDRFFYQLQRAREAA